ncbi:MAG: hypothetical protein CMA25_03415 [Euryarchaeota archaeon]|nr:hypothetical protein [Euryarchaeota archaeon]
MNRKKQRASLMLLLIMLTNLSGCLSISDENTKDDSLAKDSVSASLSTQCIEFEQIERCWSLLVPGNLSATDSVSLVLDLHGHGGSSESQHEMSGFANLAVEKKFIVAYPQGYENFWGINIDGVDNDLDDVGFLLTIIETIVDTYPVNEKKIYMTGWSNGCMMTQRFAVETQNILASAGCMSGYLMTDAPSSYTAPIPFMEVHGMLDETVNYVDNTGTTMFYFQNIAGLNKGATQNLDYWADLNGCNGLAPELITINEDYDIRGYSECDSGAEVRLMSLFVAGHNPYLSGNPTGTPSSTILWDFMSQFTME